MFRETPTPNRWGFLVNMGCVNNAVVVYLFNRKEGILGFDGEYFKPVITK